MKKRNKFHTVNAETNDLAKFFQDNYQANGNVSVELSYILQCGAILIFIDSRLIGGCIFNNGEKHWLRYLKILKNDLQRQNMLKNEGFIESNLMEISCIFHTKGISRFERYVFYTIVFWKAWSFAKKHNKIAIIGGSLVKPTQDYQTKVFRHILIQTPVDDSFVTHGKISGVAKVYYCMLNTFLTNAFILLLGDLISDIWRGITK